MRVDGKSRASRCSVLRRELSNGNEFAAFIFRTRRSTIGCAGHGHHGASAIVQIDLEDRHGVERAETIVTYGKVEIESFLRRSFDVLWLQFVCGGNVGIVFAYLLFDHIAKLIVGKIQRRSRNDE